MLTSMEAELLDALHYTLDFLTGRPTRGRLLDVMGRVRAMVIKLENKKYGCETGKHSGFCSCTIKNKYNILTDRRE